MYARKKDLNVTSKRMLSWDEAQAYTGLGRASCRSYCESIGAIRKYGRRVLFDRYIIDANLNEGQGEI